MTHATVSKYYGPISTLRHRQQQILLFPHKSAAFFFFFHFVGGGFCHDPGPVLYGCDAIDMANSFLRTAQEKPPPARNWEKKKKKKTTTTEEKVKCIAARRLRSGTVVVVLCQSHRPLCMATWPGAPLRAKMIRRSEPSVPEVNTNKIPMAPWLFSFWLPVSLPPSPVFVLLAPICYALR